MRYPQWTDNLKVVVKGAQFTSAATADTNYTVIGKVSGSFKAKATNTVSNKVINFNYAWTGSRVQQVQMQLTHQT